ncbi:MAG TPA: RNA methyltransferase [Methylomirabilota bacterium]|nr:RNA methyltransferase [Methylomirabilota bacterium]
MHIERVTALDRPELAPYATLRQHEEHKRAGIFVAEGDKVVRRLLESHFGAVSVLLPEKRLAEFEPLIRARSEDVPVYVMEIAQLEKLTGFPFFQGVLAVGKVPETHTIETVLGHTVSPRLFVAIDGLTNAENVGLVVRNCAAFGVQALIVDGSSASPFLRRAVRNSMGTIFKLPIVEATDLHEALRLLRRAKVHLVAAHPHTEQRTIGGCSFTRDCCVVFGSEGVGLSSELLSLCDESASIPMSNEVDSLNVGSAAAVFLYEAARQRTSGLSPLDVSVRE